MLRDNELYNNLFIVSHIAWAVFTERLLSLWFSSSFLLGFFSGIIGMFISTFAIIMIGCLLCIPDEKYVTSIELPGIVHLTRKTTYYVFDRELAGSMFAGVTITINKRLF